MNVTDVYNLVKKIVSKSNDLKNKYTDETFAKVNYACIFCKDTDEYNCYIELLKKDNNRIIEDTYSGPLFRLKGLDTVAGTLKLLKIRKYDDKHQDLGDADFTVKNYSEFKDKYINNSNFKLINGEGYEMLELMEENNNIRTYFSNPPLDEELEIN